MFARLNILNSNDKLQVWKVFKKFKFMDFDQILSYNGAIVKTDEW